jgi:flagellar basal-body rod modification protein FlgD
MAIDSVSLFSPQSSSSAASGASARNAKKALGQEDFLKLLAVQFQSQDPMKPMEDSAFIAQMAQFTSLEQSSSMNTTMSQIRAEQRVATANSYLGLVAVVEDKDGNLKSGQVTAVDTTTDTPKLEIDGKYYDVSSVLRTEHPALLRSGMDATPTAASGV